jgi:hypothetical protein
LSLRIWLHEGNDGEPGITALGLDHLGFSTWAEDVTTVLDRVPARFEVYRDWRARHGVAVEGGTESVEVVDHLVGHEVLFGPDGEAASPEEIDLAIRLLGCSRADLVRDVEAAPVEALDWDPPYRRFAPWADWRTIRAVLAHIANGETHYYTRNIGHEPSGAPADPAGDWRAFLKQSRDEAVAFLVALRGSPDLCRVRVVDCGYGEESWSVRKSLRRMVAHERMHHSSILRILREFDDRRAAREPS